MSKQRLAQILTVLILAAALGVTLARKNGWTWRGVWQARQTVEATPEGAIYAMLDAARKGDVKKYLASYSGSMESSLRQSISESSDAAFRQYLQDTNAMLKGVAVLPPEKTEDREVKVRVEYVYQDRNEAQTMYLEKTAAGWKIARVDAAQRVKTLVPYGTPVR
ncbi:MAG TPA: hypothetical protein VGV35_18720 [Bryobacteraceae bacterium]|nr:hypothetical protein [Bryobacteraceae bacterium]